MHGLRTVDSRPLDQRFLRYSKYKAQCNCRNIDLFDSILMQWAEGGSLDDFIDARLGKETAHPFLHVHPSSSRSQSRPSSSSDLRMDRDASVPMSRGARIRAFRAMQHASPEERERLQRDLGISKDLNQGQLKAVHLLSAVEVKSLFQDVVEGLSFLVCPCNPDVFSHC